MSHFNDSEQPLSLSFEAAIEALEDIISQMGEGGLALEKALELFQSGVQLTQTCYNHLSKAEQKVQLLLHEQNTLITKPFYE